MTDPFLVGFGLLVAAAFGGFGHRLLLDRRRNQSSLCPTCYGPLDEDGTSEAFGARLEPAEGTVVLAPEDERSGFVMLDDGRVGRVDVVPAEVMLLADDVGMFSPESDDPESATTDG